MHVNSHVILALSNPIRNSGNNMTDNEEDIPLSLTLSCLKYTHTHPNTHTRTHTHTHTHTHRTKVDFQEISDSVSQ